MQNPSDALEILARVADRAEDSNSGEDQSGQSKDARQSVRPHGLHEPKIDGYWYYKPIHDGTMTPEMVFSLFSRLVARLPLLTRTKYA